jgi:hypothetical protein
VRWKLQALNCLETLFEERVGYYRNADAVVSVAGILHSSLKKQCVLCNSLLLMTSVQRWALYTCSLVFISIVFTLAGLAAKMDLDDVGAVTPIMLAVQVSCFHMLIHFM